MSTQSIRETQAIIENLFDQISAKILYLDSRIDSMKDRVNHVEETIVKITNKSEKQTKFLSPEFYPIESTAQVEYQTIIHKDLDQGVIEPKFDKAALQMTTDYFERIELNTRQLLGRVHEFGSKVATCLTRNDPLSRLKSVSSIVVFHTGESRFGQFDIHSNPKRNESIEEYSEISTDNSFLSNFSTLFVPLEELPPPSNLEL